MIKKAFAIIKGGTIYPKIDGVVFMTEYREGVEVTAKIHNLPEFSREDGKVIGPFGFHIHNGKSCKIGDDQNPFPLAGGHFNPTDTIHGNHAGDFPSLMAMSNNIAIIKFMTDKFTLQDVIGLPVVIHQSPDDFRTDPDGNSGLKIACGIIKAY